MKGGAVKRQWSLDDLIEHFTLLPNERQLIAALRTDYTRLGFAVLLKCFLLDGRCPQYRMDVPTSVVAFLAKQLGLDPVVYVQYDWRGRSSEEHRAQIRALLGFREATVQDSDDVAANLAMTCPTYTWTSYHKYRVVLSLEISA